MTKLLNDKWDNSILHDLVQTGTTWVRRDTKVASQEDRDFRDYCRNTAFYLVDHPQLEKFNNNVLVEAKNSNFLFILKSDLVKKLDSQTCPDSDTVANKVAEYVMEAAKNAKNHQNVTQVPQEDFVALLKLAKLDDVVEKLDLEPKTKTKPRM